MHRYSDRGHAPHASRAHGEDDGSRLDAPRAAAVSFGPSTLPVSAGNRARSGAIRAVIGLLVMAGETFWLSIVGKQFFDRYGSAFRINI